MTKTERLNIIQEAINNVQDDSVRAMYQSLPVRIVYPTKTNSIKQLGAIK